MNRWREGLNNRYCFVVLFMGQFMFILVFEVVIKGVFVYKYCHNTGDHPGQHEVEVRTWTFDYKTKKAALLEAAF